MSNNTSTNTIGTNIGEATISSTSTTKTNSRSVVMEDGASFKYNDRVLWPQIIKEPVNKWIYSFEEVLEKLNFSTDVALTKKKIEKVVLFFYKMKSALNLQEHTYITACILFYRFWMTFKLPSEMNDCMDIALSVLVTACKCSENNRPIRAYVDTAVNLLNSGVPMNQQKLEKIKWKVRENFFTNEMKFIAMMNLDFDIYNPRQFIEEVFSVQHRLSRDKDLPKEFEKAFPNILKEARIFIYQSEAQPVSLLCDGITYVQYALIFAALQYKKKVDDTFKYPKNFFKNRFPKLVDPIFFAELANSHYKIEKNFLKMGSNKGDLLLITTDDIREILNEDIEEDKESTMGKENKKEEEESIDSNILETSTKSSEPAVKKQCIKDEKICNSEFYYLNVNDIECNEFLKYTEDKILAHYEEEFKKSSAVSGSTSTP